MIPYTLYSLLTLYFVRPGGSLEGWGQEASESEYWVKEHSYMYARGATLDDSYVNLDDPNKLECYVVPVYQGRGRRPSPISFETLSKIDRHCKYAAGLYSISWTSPTSYTVNPVSSVELMQVYADRALIALPYWACVHHDYKIAEGQYIHPSSYRSCDFLVNLQTLEAFHVKNEQMFYLESASYQTVDDFFFVTFYFYDENDDSFSTAQVKDLFKRNPDTGFLEAYPVGFMSEYKAYNPGYRRPTFSDEL